MLANLDDIVSLINRILEAEEEDCKEEAALATSLGSEVVGNFVNSIGKTILAIFQDLEHKLADGTLTSDYIEAHMKKASNIYAFCHVVGRKYGEHVFTAVNKVIVTKSQEMTQVLINMRDMGDEVPHAGTYLVIIKNFVDSLASARR